MSKVEKKVNHYVYKITDIITGEFYIGSRTCKCNPENDTYMGSYYVWKPDDSSNLKKEVIKSDFNNRNEAVMYEANLIKSNIDNELNRNYHIPNGGFHSYGRVSVKDEYGNTFSIDKNDERYINGELKPVTYNTVPVIDKDGNSFRISKEDPRYISGEVWFDFKPLSDDARRKISETLKGHTVSDETRKLQSKNNGRFFKGKKRPEVSDRLKREHAEGKRSCKHLHEVRTVEHNKKIGQAQFGKLSKSAIPVLQFTKAGEFIRRWDCMVDVYRELGIRKVSRCCAGHQKTAGGYVWKYEVEK
jgi:hypothetical protein